MLGRGMPSSRDGQWALLATVGLFFNNLVMLSKRGTLNNFMLGGGTPGISQLQGRGMPSSHGTFTNFEYFKNFKNFNMFTNSRPPFFSSSDSDAHYGHGNYPSIDSSDFVWYNPLPVINQHERQTRGRRCTII